MDIIKKIVALEDEASEFGFAWERADQIMAQIDSECVEVREHLQQNPPQVTDELREEIGDLFHAVFSLSVFCDINPEEAITQAADKFERRLTAVKAIAAAKGLTNLKNHSFHELMAIWQAAKGQT